MSNVFLMTALVSSFSATAVFAGGFAAPVVEVEPVVAVAPAKTGWGGGYVGGNINYGKGKLKSRGTVGDAADIVDNYLGEDYPSVRELLAEEFGGDFLDESIAQTLLKPDGTSAAVRAGYDWQNGAFVYGLGAEYNVGKYKDSIGGEVELEGMEPFDASARVEFKNMATIYARAGYAFSEQFMAYGVLGYSRSKGKVTLAVNDKSFSGSETLSGVTYGLGAEYKFNQNWSSYAEYTHTDFGKVKNTHGLLKAEVGQVKLGVNYRF